MSGTFDESSARRIGAAVRNHERNPNRKNPRGTAPRNFGGAAMLLTTTTITRGSGATPGTGSGKLQQFNGTSYSDLASTVYPILNDTTALVATGAYVLCVPGPGGKFHFVMTSCGNIS